MYSDGDGDLPTICETGLEDYVGSAHGMGPHHALYGGAPLDVREHERKLQPDFVGFYRWHVPDPVMFSDELRVTIQQIGYALFAEGQQDRFARFEASHPVAGAGWEHTEGVLARGIAERVDDYCATAYVYATEPQPVTRLDLTATLADIERRPYEQPGPLEGFLGP